MELTDKTKTRANQTVAALAIIYTMPGSSGAIDCPRCKCQNSLRWSRAWSNGHVNGRCSTAGCLHFIQ